MTRDEAQALLESGHDVRPEQCTLAYWGEAGPVQIVVFDRVYATEFPGEELHEQRYSLFVNGQQSVGGIISSQFVRRTHEEEES